MKQLLTVVLPLLLSILTLEQCIPVHALRHFNMYVAQTHATAGKQESHTKYTRYKKLQPI